MVLASVLPLAPLEAPASVLSTGSSDLNEVCGGIPRATLTEIVGGPSSGRTGLLLSLLHQATLLGECCVLVDAHDAFDPTSASLAGVQLSRLLWVRCGGIVENE